jgi:hypothetical protein
LIRRESFDAMRMPIRSLFLALSGLVGLAAPVAAEPTFVGIWYSAFQPDEPGVMSLIEFRADGTFYEEFRKCEDGKEVGYQYESGTWALVDGIEKTVADMINGQAAKVENTYMVELLSETERRIRATEGGYVFVAHRVDTFEFPDCANGA